MASPYANWESGAYYKVGDIVQYLGVYYKAIVANIGVTPSASSPWSIFVPPTQFPSGVFDCANASLQSIPITGLSQSSLVNITFINGDGANPSPSITSYVASANQLDLQFSDVIGGDKSKIIWSVAKFS